MKQLVVLTRVRDWEHRSWSDLYLVASSTHPEQNFRDAVKEYLLTKEGRAAIRETSEDFNWGDSIMYVPMEIWNKYGIEPINEGDNVTVTRPTVVTVDQDEILIPSQYYDEQ